MPTRATPPPTGTSHAQYGIAQDPVKGDRGSAFGYVLAEFAQTRDPRGPLIGSLRFWGPFRPVEISPPSVKRKFQRRKLRRMTLSGALEQVPPLQTFKQSRH